MFEDFEECFTPKSVDDIVFSNDENLALIKDLINGDRPFPIKEGKCGILLYGVNGTGKSALAKVLPDAIERARGGEQACEMYVRVLPGSNGMNLIQRIANRAMLVPYGNFNYFVLDEVDELRGPAMSILKSAMNYVDTVWVLTTNRFSDIDAGVKDRCYCIPFNAAPAERWFDLARRILAHAGVQGIADEQLDAVIAPCNGSARQITDAIISLAMSVRHANQQVNKALATSVV